jgi:hypothetical protein
MVLAEEGSGVGAGGYRTQFHIGMPKQQPE